jgi:hypothetical protein
MSGASRISCLRSFQANSLRTSKDRKADNKDDEVLVQAHGNG